MTKIVFIERELDSYQQSAVGRIASYERGSVTVARVQMHFLMFTEHLSDEQYLLLQLVASVVENPDELFEGVPKKSVQRMIKKFVDQIQKLNN